MNNIKTKGDLIMNRYVLHIMKAALVCFLFTLPTHALVGAGIQWGFDFTLDMDDSFDDPLSFEQPAPLLDMIDSIPNIGNALQGIMSVDSLKSLIPGTNAETALPFTLSRTEWTRSVINFGGKVFIDAIPVIDAVELSFNMGAWEYEALLKYPTGEVQDNITQEDIDEFLETGNYEKLLEMEEVPLTLEQFDLRYLKMFGLSKTPYFRLHVDALIRKNLFAVPKKMKLFSMYLGGGVSLHLGTPIITPSFIEDALDSPVRSSFAETAPDKNKFKNIAGVGTREALMKDIVQRLIDASKKPTFGMNFIGGTMIKLPAIPIGFFADAKFMLPFKDLDDNVDIGGRGFLINAGVCITL